MEERAAPWNVAMYPVISGNLKRESYLRGERGRGERKKQKAKNQTKTNNNNKKATFLMIFLSVKTEKQASKALPCVLCQR